MRPRPARALEHLVEERSEVVAGGQAAVGPGCDIGSDHGAVRVHPAPFTCCRSLQWRQPNRIPPLPSRVMAAPALSEIERPAAAPAAARDAHGRAARRRDAEGSTASTGGRAARDRSSAGDPECGRDRVLAASQTLAIVPFAGAVAATASLRRSRPPSSAACSVRSPRIVPAAIARHRSSTCPFPLPAALVRPPGARRVRALRPRRAGGDRRSRSASGTRFGAGSSSPAPTTSTRSAASQR